MQSRLKGDIASTSSIATPGKALQDAVILGIDPSLRGTGYGVVHVKRSASTALGFGTIRCSKDWVRSRCLAQISQTIDEAIKKHRPEICVVEGLFHARNIKTALIMGEARGAALASVARHGLPIFEIAPRKVKQAIVGYGAAQKLAVARMVQRMLHIGEELEPDAADALAIALAHALGQAGAGVSAPEPI